MWFRSICCVSSYGANTKASHGDLQESVMDIQIKLSGQQMRNCVRVKSKYVGMKTF